MKFDDKTFAKIILRDMFHDNRYVNVDEFLSNHPKTEAYPEMARRIQRRLDGEYASLKPVADDIAIVFETLGGHEKMAESSVLQQIYKGMEEDRRALAEIEVNRAYLNACCDVLRLKI